LPFFDAIRVGQMHVPFGLEAYASSRWLSTLERSPQFDAFYQEFAPGIFFNETFLDQRITAQQMIHRIDYFNQFNGASFGDGRYAYTARVSGLPIYEDDGRYLVHLGLAYQFRNGSTPADFNNGTTLATRPNPLLTPSTELFRFRTRVDLRDAVGLQGDGARVVDTGNIIADNVQAVNGEFLAYAGPASVQAEWVVARTTNAFYPASNKATAQGDLVYSGAYAQVGYVLTGENRGYDKRMGKHDRLVPNEPFFCVEDENGSFGCGWGAWELVYRYGYVDLNDKQVLGGWYGEHTIGVNWYWTSNIKMQFNYINGQRSVQGPATTGAASGNIQGFAVRAAMEF
jgi:phosphate-selective porin OprO/OprP